MGLGKTIQTLSLFAYLKATTNLSGPHLVVTPVSVIQNWVNEIQRFTPQLSFCRISGGISERDSALSEADILSGEKDVYLTSYEMIHLEESFFADSKFRWATVTIDEGHRVKNEATQLSKSLVRIQCPFRLLLTGTPVQNNLHELWALLAYILPELFTDSARFDEGVSILNDTLDRNLCSEASALLEGCCMLRRLKSDVEKDLLPKVQCKLYVPLTPVQRRWYRHSLTRKAVAATAVTVGDLYCVLAQLRRICNHPRQILLKRDAERAKARKRALTRSPHALSGLHEPILDALTGEALEEEEELRGLTGDALVASSGKLALLDRLLLRLRTAGSRVLVFSQVHTPRAHPRAATRRPQRRGR
jgi:SWI/SNF-related matrix-associated actin-dependent regulator of chromatin subfamily A member 5